MQTNQKVSANRRRLPGFAGWLVLSCGLLMTGCDTMSYYRQAATGQYEIFAKQQPIPDLLARSNITPSLRRELEYVLDLRQFAEHELKLETDGHYFQYADLGRRHVVWNVNATPEFSLEPKKWWYPVVGSLKYRGFFAEKDARAYGAQLTKEGFDVYVGGVDAYSTLGWFKDPVLNTFIHDPPAELAETLFHELAHQRVFASGDTDFNEAFATCVGEEGARRWLLAHADAKARSDYELDLQRQAQFVALIMKTREELKRVYGEAAPEDGPAGEGASRKTLANVRRIEKGTVLTKLRAEYEALKTSWGGYTGYDNWFKRPINNSHLNTVATYQRLVPAFRNLLERNDGNMEKFYVAAAAMSRMEKEQRHQQMAALATKTNQLAGTTLKWISQPDGPGPVTTALPQ